MSREIPRTIQTILGKIYLEDIARDLLSGLVRTARSVSWHIKRDLLRADKKIIADYFREHKVKKLQIGCGPHGLNGWLNSDYYPVADQNVHLDATNTFPFNNDAFDYVFSEHMIEHITYSQGLSMLAECYRVLRPNGKLRIATPDLLFLMDLYRSDKSDLQKQYIQWATDQFFPSAPDYDGIFVFDHFVRRFGHQFIYDEKTLRYSLEKVGFRSVVKRYLNDSDDGELVGLENEARLPPGFLRLESMVLEATKPSAQG